ncbi:asparagine synthase-related protein [Nonomuraea sp. B19D2]|uniref:asparagine synthase-related protein n=1 Tax=Nonomuraea sp. B19D2 TaxID=3159561 RepID=UPI0032DA9F83
MENQNGHTERLFKAVGVEVRVPYCDHRLLQYAYSLPWELQYYDGREQEGAPGGPGRSAAAQRRRKPAPPQELIDLAQPSENGT